jgi:putative redox protein
MKISLSLVEEPFVLEGKNSDGNTVLMDASPKIGGQNKGMRPVELLGTSIAGCMSIDMLSILRKQRQEITLFEIEVDIDRKDQTPSTLEKVSFTIYVNPEVLLSKVEQAYELSITKYCSVALSLDPTITFTANYKHK